jgi:hypothetical protein
MRSTGKQTGIVGSRALANDGPPMKKVVEEASKAGKPHKVAEAKQNYEAMINTCRGATVNS